jgi:ribosomal subunit interface protein
MQSPVQVTFRDIPPSDALFAHVEKRAAKLDTFFDRIHTCHVVVEAPHRHRTKGKKFHCRIDIHLPGKELVVSKSPEEAKEDAHVAIDDAFADAERALEAFARLIQPDTKTHLKPPHGVVSKVFRDRGYGFIAADGDGHEVYFHQNSVVGARFEKLEPGTRVRYAEEDGDKGPQASTVYVIGEPRTEGSKGEEAG